MSWLNETWRQLGLMPPALGGAGLTYLLLSSTSSTTATGRLEPSYDAIAAKAGVCHRTVAAALARLKQLGLLHWQRRCSADKDSLGRFRLKQDTNAYTVRPPSQRNLAGLWLIVLFTISPPPAKAEDARLFGVQAGPLSSTPGAFIPSGTRLACYGVKNGQCWDGTTWHRLYPTGPRHYAAPTSTQVACRVIVNPQHDCWDGSAWYHLSPGQLFGVVAGVLSPTPGAFLTVPLR